MANLSTAVRNAKADAIEATIGASAKLLIFSGAKPANCAAADPSGLLCTINLPADWLTAAASGAVAKNGVWSGTGSGAGNAASWRIKDNAGTTCHMQGTAAVSAAELILDNVNIAVGQTVTVNSFSWTEGDA
jgi:hypothetical protein